jgi:hypothetical protein
MELKEKFKCEYCPSILSSKSNRESHMKRNKSCLKLRGLSFMTFKDKQIICASCGFTTLSNNGLNGHTCRSESIEQINKIKLLESVNDKLNNEIKSIKLDNKNIIIDKNNKYRELEIELKKTNNDIFNLDRDLSITIAELKVEIKEYKLKIFDIASKPNNVTNNNNNSTTNTTNNIQMLIQKLLPVCENDMIKLFEEVCTKKTMLNGVDSLMEELGSAMRYNHMLCTDTNRNKLTYKNEENEIMKDTNGKLILPQLCKWGQFAIDKGYMEAETEIKNRTTNEDDYDTQMKYLDNEWQYKYPRIKSGIGEKEIKKAAKILSEKVKVT